jgi:hypothetical protein
MQSISGPWSLPEAVEVVVTKVAEVVRAVFRSWSPH